MDDSDTLPFLPRIDAKAKRPPPDDDEPEEAVAPGNAFAVARGLRAPATLRFLHADGSLIFALAYARLPTVWGDVPGAILLEYANFGSILLPGKNLKLLETRLCEYRVTWIRECTDAEAASLATAVTCVRRVNRYPSREADGDPRTAVSKDENAWPAATGGRLHTSSYARSGKIARGKF